MIRRLHGSFQFPTVLALHLYVSGTLPILLNAFSGLRLDRAAPCELSSQETVCGCAETARPFSGHLAGYGSELGPAEYSTVQRLASLKARFLAVVENSMPQCGFAVKSLFAKG